jgi:hypothetical protein
MYLRDGSLADLETLLWGYYAALQAHGLVENVPRMDHHFRWWLYDRKGWSPTLDWATALEHLYREAEARHDAFFGLVDEYRRLQPAAVCTIQLGPQHQPTGTRVLYGVDGRLEKPERVDVMRYRPKPLHFLRLHYPDRMEDWDLLMTSTLELATSVADAQRWVQDELQVEPSAWGNLT